MTFVSKVIKVFIFKQVCLNHLLACFDVYSRNYFPLFSNEFSFPIKNLFKHNMSMFSTRNLMSFKFFYSKLIYLLISIKRNRQNVDSRCAALLYTSFLGISQMKQTKSRCLHAYTFVCSPLTVFAHVP